MSQQLLEQAIATMSRNECLALLGSEHCSDAALRRATASAIVETRTGVAPPAAPPARPSAPAARPPAPTPPLPPAATAAGAAPAANTTPALPKASKAEADQAVIALHKLSTDSNVGFATGDVAVQCQRMGYSCSKGIASGALSRALKAGWLFNAGDRRFSRYGATLAIAQATSNAARGK